MTTKHKPTHAKKVGNRKPGKTRMQRLKEFVATTPALDTTIKSPGDLRYGNTPPPSTLQTATERMHLPFWQVGFEVEKNSSFVSQHRHPSNSYAVRVPTPGVAWAGIVSDGSCGYEMNSHAFYLREGTEREWFREIMKASASALEGHADARCGGHVTISAAHVPDSRWLWNNIRARMGLVYALFQKRLGTVQYAGGNNKRLQRMDSGIKYAPCKFRHSKQVEIRLFGRVQNYKNMLFRYDMLLEMAHAIDLDLSFEDFLSSATPFLLRWKSRERVIAILESARHYQAFIDTGVVHQSISRHVGNSHTW
jgi:hypothetical protein